LIEKNNDYRELCLASAGRIINEEVAKETNMLQDNTTPHVEGDAL
jgi:hypothetical protein